MGRNFQGIPENLLIPLRARAVEVEASRGRPLVKAAKAVAKVQKPLQRAGRPFAMVEEA